MCITLFLRTGMQNNNLTFSFLQLWYNPLEFNSRENCQLVTNIIEGDGIRAIKFDTTRLHFLRDVFIAVAVIVA